MTKSPALEALYLRGSKLLAEELSGPFTPSFSTPWKSGKFQKAANVLSAFIMRESDGPSN